MKVSMCSLKCKYISSYKQRKNIFFLKIVHWYGLFFYIITFLLEISPKIEPQTFLREKISTSAVSKYCTPLLTLN